MDEIRYEDSVEIISAELEAEDSIKKQRKNLIKGIFYCLVCVVCFYLLTK